MARALTAKQKAVLDFIADSIESRGIGPSYREIGDQLGCKVGTAQDHVQALIAKGFLVRTGRGLARAFSLAGKSQATLPVAGRVGAGGAVLAEQDLEGRLSFRDFSRRTDYLLRVRGDSMDGAGILAGDLVQVHRQQIADDGDLVVALKGDEVFVKTFRKRGPTLESANESYVPIPYPFKVIGKVVGLVRRYDADYHLV